MKWRGKKNAIQVSAYLNITSIFKEKKKKTKKQDLRVTGTWFLLGK